MVVQNKFMWGVSKTANVKDKERCDKLLKTVLAMLLIGEVGKMIVTKVLEHTIFVMAVTEKAYFLWDKSRVKGKLHIQTVVF